MWHSPLKMGLSASANTSGNESNEHSSTIDSLQLISKSVGNGATKYYLTKNNTPVYYMEAIQLLAADKDGLIDMLISTLQLFPAEAVLFECISTTPATVGTTKFEFVIIPAPSLATIRTDIGPFREKFDEQKARGGSDSSDSKTATFYNLGRDAMLIVPCPVNERDFATPPDYMAHLTKFMRGSSADQMKQFWTTVGRAMFQTLQESPLPNKRFWLSTSGLGVSWLHMRVDTVPKYYNWNAYKNVN